jgi:hypothetical protein
MYYMGLNISRATLAKIEGIADEMGLPVNGVVRFVCESALDQIVNDWRALDYLQPLERSRRLENVHKLACEKVTAE